MTKLIQKQSTNGGHPYQKLTFWRNPSNFFWETDYFTEKGKQYFRDSIQDMIKEERKFYLDNKKAL